MNVLVKDVMDFFRAMTKASGLKSGQGFSDRVASRLNIASTQPTLFRAGEAYAQAMQVNMQYVSPRKFSAFMKAGASPESEAMLSWIRENPRIAAAILTMKSDKRDEDGENLYHDVQDTEEYRQIIDVIELPPVDTLKEKGHALPQREHDIQIRMICRSALAHGGDVKAGNSTLFRRQELISTTGNLLVLPYIDGNAPRGLLRDLLAVHFLHILSDGEPENIQWGVRTPKGMKNKILSFFQQLTNGKPTKLWLYHALFSGGSLEENSSSMKQIMGKLGGNGATKAEGIHEFRDMIPMLSVLGTALGNRIINGSINVCKFEPMCREYGTGELSVNDLMTWTFITRRDDDEERALDEKSHAMIANTECLKAGTVLLGGIDYDMVTNEVEMSCIGKALELWQEMGYFGAENRHGLGEIDLEFDAPSGDLYESYLLKNRLNILNYLEEIGGIHESGKLAI